MPCPVDHRTPGPAQRGTPKRRRNGRQDENDETHHVAHPPDGHHGADRLYPHRHRSDGPHMQAGDRKRVQRKRGSPRAQERNPDRKRQNRTLADMRPIRRCRDRKTGNKAPRLTGGRRRHHSIQHHNNRISTGRNLATIDRAGRPAQPGRE